MLFYRQKEKNQPHPRFGLKSSLFMAIAGASFSSFSLQANALPTSVFEQSSGLMFDGASFESFTHQNDFEINDGAVAFWLKTTAIGSRQGLWSKDSSGYDTGGHVSIMLEPDGRVRYRIQSTTGTVELYSTTQLSIDTWDHITASFGADGAKLYVNGVLEDSNNYSGGLGDSSGGAGNFEPFVVGANAWSSDDLKATPVQNYYDGELRGLNIFGDHVSGSDVIEIKDSTDPEAPVVVEPLFPPALFELSDTLAFDGGSYHEVPHQDLFLLNDGSVSLWFKSSNDGVRQGLFSKDSSGYDTGGHTSLMIESDGRLRFRFQSTTGTEELYGSTHITKDELHHVLISFGSEGMQLYLDGELESENSATLGLGSQSGGIGNFEPIVLGANAWKSDDLIATPVEEHFKGEISHFSLFGSQLSIEETLALFNEGIPSEGSGPAVDQLLDNQVGPMIYSGDAYQTIPHQDAFLTDNGTVGFWLNIDSVGNRQGLWSKDASGYGTGGHMSIMLEPDGRIRARIQNLETSIELYSDTQLSAGDWVHVAVVFGQEGLKLYVDGALESSNDYVGGFGATSGGTGNFEPIVLGANAWASDDLSALPVKEYFTGTLENVIFYSEEFTSEAVSQLQTDTAPEETDTTNPSAPSQLPLANLQTFYDAFLGGFIMPNGLSGTSDEGDSISFMAGKARAGYNRLNHSFFMGSRSAGADVLAIMELKLPEDSELGLSEAFFPIADTVLQNWSSFVNTDRIPELKYSDNDYQANREFGGFFYDANTDELWANTYKTYSGGSFSEEIMRVDAASDLNVSTAKGGWNYENRDQTAGWIVEVPAQWVEALDTSMLVGFGAGISNQQRYSLGPSMMSVDFSEALEDSRNTLDQTEFMNWAYIDEWYNYYPGMGAGLYGNYTNTLENYNEYNQQGTAFDGQLEADIIPADNDVWTRMSSASIGFIIPGTRTYAVLGQAGGTVNGGGYKIVDSEGNKSGGPTAAYGDYLPYYWLFDLNEILALQAPGQSIRDAVPYEYGAFPIVQGAPDMPRSGSFDLHTGRLYLITAPSGAGTSGQPPHVYTFKFEGEGE